MSWIDAYILLSSAAVLALTIVFLASIRLVNKRIDDLAYRMDQLAEALTKRQDDLEAAYRPSSPEDPKIRPQPKVKIPEFLS